MRYPELIEKLFSVNVSGGVKLGLENPLLLDRLMGNPSSAVPVVHVAGTNGKGSVCWKVASALRRSGYKVGLYSSPHISSFRERIRVNGQPIPISSVETILAELFELAEGHQIDATFFELTTALAFKYFALCGVDVAVIEVGLGGRLDATNIVKPLLSCITSISYDHCDLLGSSLEAIAREKAGIIKPAVALVLGPRVPQETVLPIAEALGSPCAVVAGDFDLYDEENSSIAACCLKELRRSFDIPPESEMEALKERPPCRLELVNFQGIPVLLDVAHNPDGLRALFAAVAQQFPGAAVQLLLGLSASKDVSACLDVVHSHVEHIHLVSATNGRAASPMQLSDMLRDKGVPLSRYTLYKNVAAGLGEALRCAANDGKILLVCGTFFIMSEVRALLGICEERDAVDMNERVGGHR